MHWDSFPLLILKVGNPNDDYMDLNKNIRQKSRCRITRNYPNNDVTWAALISTAFIIRVLHFAVKRVF